MPPRSLGFDLCLLILVYSFHVLLPSADSVGGPGCSAGWVKQKASSTASRWETPPSPYSSVTSSFGPLAQGLRALCGEDLVLLLFKLRNQSPKCCEYPWAYPVQQAREGTHPGQVNSPSKDLLVKETKRRNVDLTQPGYLTQGFVVDWCCRIYQYISYNTGVLC